MNFACCLFVCILHFFPSQIDRVTPVSPVQKRISQDTLVNYCQLLQSGYAYGQLFTQRKTVLSDAEVSQFNHYWKDVFNIPMYQKGITKTEFVQGSRFSEGNEVSFPPSSTYPSGSPDTYMLFHLAKEIGMIRSQAFERCPSCIEMSISKVAAYIKVTPVEHLLSENWPRLQSIPRILTQAETDTVWNNLQCLFPDTLIDPKAVSFALSKPEIHCTDTIQVLSFGEIRPEVLISWPGCSSAGIVDTIGPVLISGKWKRRKSVYQVKFIATSLCGRLDSCHQYFVIRKRY